MTHERLTHCKSCHAPIVWLTMPGSGKSSPTNADTVRDDDVTFEWGRHVSHFATCPQAAHWRKPKK